MKIQFSDFELDEDRLLLERIEGRVQGQAGERVALRPKVFDLLIQLVANRARVVRREELIGNLWRGMAVGSGSLSGLVNELRQALGEDGNGPSSIRTVHARGYQFVAPVVEIGEEPILGLGFKPKGPGSSVPPRVSMLVKRVSEEGAHGILIPTDLTESVVNEGDLPVSPVENAALAQILTASTTAGFEVQTLRVPDESMASPIWLIRSLIDALVASRGSDRVAQALPLPARAWFEDRQGHRVAGGPGNTTMGPPGGLGAVASLVSAFARRRPLVWVLDGVDRGGPRIVRDLGALLRFLVNDPVLWIGTLMPGTEAGPVRRGLEGNAGYAYWAACADPAASLGEEWLRTGYQPLPEPLRRALLAHFRGDVGPMNELLEWAAREAQIKREGPQVLRRVEPCARIGTAARLES